MSSKRDDGLLYTGMHSASFAKERIKRENSKAERSKTQARLSPAGELVRDEINKHLVGIGNELGNLIHLEMSETDVKATVLGLRIAHNRMTQLKTRMNQLLKPVEQSGDEDE